jgi:hypothetical protein
MTSHGLESHDGQVVKTYAWIAMCIMAFALFLFGNLTLNLFKQEDRKPLKDISKNPMLAAWYLLLPPNMTMTFVYFIEHFVMLVRGTTSHIGGLCSFVAFWAIAAVVSINGSSVTISYVTYRLVKDGKKPELKTILIGNGLSWALGLAIAIIFMTGHSIGPYQGLYCCVKEAQYHGYRVALIFTSFAVSVAAQTYFYYRSWKIVKATESGVLQSTGRGVKASRAVMKRGVEMVSIFYCCWFIIFVNSIIAYNGQTPNIWAGVVGAWMAKLNPVLHCLMMVRNIRKSRKVATTSAAVSHGSRMDDNEKDLPTLGKSLYDTKGSVDQITKAIRSEFTSLKEELLAKLPGLDVAPGSAVSKQQQLETELTVLRRQLAEATQNNLSMCSTLQEKITVLQNENDRLVAKIQNSQGEGEMALNDCSEITPLSSHAV